MDVSNITQIAVALVSIGATLFSVWAGKRYMEKRKKDCLVNETIQNANVYTALQYLLEEARADRAYVLEFHNGEHYFSGRGQQKFSCSYEVVREGISAESEQSQNHRVSNYHHYISEMVKDGHFSYSDTKLINDVPFVQMLNQKGVNAIYNVPLKTLNGKIIGILGIDFVNSSPKTKEIGFDKSADKTLQDFLRHQARIIAGYLI